MIDIVGFLIWVLSLVSKIIIFPYALIRGIIYAAIDKKLGDYFYSLGYGNDLFGLKLIAPYANRHFVKEGGFKFGEPNKYTKDGNKTISFYMAINKLHGFNTPEADKWERRINLVDKNHLNKTLAKNNIMTKEQLIQQFADAIENSNSAGMTEEMNETQLNQALYAALDTVDTVSPNLPPRP